MRHHTRRRTRWCSHTYTCHSCLCSTDSRTCRSWSYSTRWGSCRSCSSRGRHHTTIRLALGCKCIPRRSHYRPGLHYTNILRHSPGCSSRCTSHRTTHHSPGYTERHRTHQHSRRRSPRCTRTCSRQLVCASRTADSPGPHLPAGHRASRAAADRASPLVVDVPATSRQAIGRQQGVAGDGDVPRCVSPGSQLSCSEGGQQAGRDSRRRSRASGGVAVGQRARVRLVPPTTDRSPRPGDQASERRSSLIDRGRM